MSAFRGTLIAAVLAAAGLSGCSKTVDLRYEPQGAETVLVSPGPVKIFVDVDDEDEVALRTARDMAHFDPIRFARPFDEVLKESLETQLKRLGAAPAASKEDADAVLTASALSLRCITGVVSAAELSFALKLENPKGGVLMDGRVHAAADAGSWWRCVAAGGALADAMSQVGGLLDASGALTALQHGSVAPPPPSGISFPPAAGARPKIYLFPPEDRVGLIYNDNNGVDPVLPYYGDAAHPFARAVAAGLAAAGLPVVAKKSDADWILKTSLVSAHAALHYVSPPETASIKLWYTLRLEDRSGAVLREDTLEGSGAYSGMIVSQSKVDGTVDSAVGQAAGGLGAFLRGGTSAAEPVYAAAAPVAVSGGGGPDAAGAFQIAAGLLSAFVPGVSNLTDRIPGASDAARLARRVPGGARVERLVHKAEKINDAVQKAKDVYDAAAPQGGAPAGDEAPAEAPVEAPAPAAK